MIRLQLKQQADPDLAACALANEGICVLFSTESEKSNDIFIENTTQDLQHFPFIQAIENLEIAIDWDDQWRRHGKNYRDGCIHLEHGITLVPGPGFGDLSHPTTELVLELMKPYVAGQSILDIGTGSGILALAAAKMRAASVRGIDIDPKALEHAKQNAARNQLEAICRFDQASGKETVILMNMIFAEQKAAWDPKFSPHTLITSGILIEEENEYLLWIKSLGFKLQKIRKKNGWLGFVCMIDSDRNL